MIEDRDTDTRHELMKPPAADAFPETGDAREAYAAIISNVLPALRATSVPRESAFKDKCKEKFPKGKYAKKID